MPDIEYLKGIYANLNHAYGKDGVVSAGALNSSFEDFSKQMQDSNYAKKVYANLDYAYGKDGVVAKGALSSDFNTFYSKAKTQQQQIPKAPQQFEYPSNFSTAGGALSQAKQPNTKSKSPSPLGKDSIPSVTIPNVPSDNGVVSTRWNDLSGDRNMSNNKVFKQRFVGLKPTAQGDKIERVYEYEAPVDLDIENVNARGNAQAEKNRKIKPTEVKTPANKWKNPIEKAVNQDKSIGKTAAGIYNSLVGSLSSLAGGAAYFAEVARPFMNIPLTKKGAETFVKDVTNTTANAEQARKSSTQFVEQARSSKSTKEDEEQLMSFDLSDGVGLGDLGGLAASAPKTLSEMGLGALTGGATFILQSVNSAAEELDKSPEAKNMSSGGKLGYIFTQAAVQAALDKVGIDVILKGSKLPKFLGNKLTNEIIKELSEKGGKYTAQQIEELAIKKATSFASKLKRVGKASGEGFLGESLTEGAQTGFGEGIKLLTNKMSGADIFDEQDIKENLVKNIINSSAAGGVFGGGGGVLSSSLNNTNKAIRKGIAEAKSQEDISNIQQQVNEQFEAGNITEEEAKAANIKVGQYAEIAGKIPTEIDNEKKYSIIGGIEQRENLKAEIDKLKQEMLILDPAFHKEKKEQLDLLNGKLGQTEDYINELVTGEKTNYVEKDGKFFKVNADGENEISKSHYEIGKLIQENPKQPSSYKIDGKEVTAEEMRSAIDEKRPNIRVDIENDAEMYKMAEDSGIVMTPTDKKVVKGEPEEISQPIELNPEITTNEEVKTPETKANEGVAADNEPISTEKESTTTAAPIEGGKRTETTEEVVPASTETSGGDAESKKTNTINGYEFTKTPSLTEADGLIVKKGSDSDADFVARNFVYTDPLTKKTLKKGVSYAGNGWYELEGENFTSVLYSPKTKEVVTIDHKKGGRTGIAVADFIKNNSRHNDNLAVRGSKYSESKHNPPFGGSGHYKGTYFYIGLDAENQAKTHGDNLTYVDLSRANLYEIDGKQTTASTLKKEAKAAGYETRDASGYAESEYLKKQGYDGIQRGNEVILFEPSKFKITQEKSISSNTPKSETKTEEVVGVDEPVTETPQPQEVVDTKVEEGSVVGGNKKSFSDNLKSKGFDVKPNGVYEKNGVRFTVENDKVYEVDNGEPSKYFANKTENSAIIENIENINANKGEASKLLDEIIQVADEQGKELQLFVRAAKVGKLGNKQLTDWYKRKGFEQRADGVMVRKPKSVEQSLKEQPQEVKPLKGENSKGGTWEEVITDKDGVKTTRFKTTRINKSGEVVEAQDGTRAGTGGREMTWDEFLNEFEPNDADLEIITDRGTPESVTIHELREGADGRNGMTVTIDWGKSEDGFSKTSRIEIGFDRSKPKAEQPKEETPISKKETTEQGVEDWSKDVESTAKALSGKTKELELPFFRGGGKIKDDITETSKYATRKVNENFDIVLDETEQPPFYVIKDKNGNKVSDKEFKTKNAAYDEALQMLGGWDKMKSEMLSEAYHKAKADGSNPELVKAVEDLLGKPTKQPKETIPNVEDWSRDVESTAKALEGVDGKKLDKIKSSLPKFSLDEYVDKVLNNEKSTKEDKELIKYQQKQEKKGFNKEDNDLFNKNIDVLSSGIFGINSWKTKDGKVEVKKISKGYGFSRNAAIPDYYEIYNNGKLIFKTDSFITAVNYTIDHIKGNKIPKSENKNGLIYHQKANEASEKVSLMGKGEDFISEAYHADKAAGKETDLTKAVEELLGKPKEEIKEEPKQSSIIEESKDVEGAVGFNAAQKKLSDLKDKYAKYFKKDGGYRANTPQNVKSEIDAAYKELNSTVKEERDKRVLEDKSDTGLIEGLNRIRNNDVAFSLVKTSIEKQLIPERLYNEFGKNLKHIIAEGNDKTEVTTQVAEIIQDFMQRENVKPDDILAKQLQEIENADFERRTAIGEENVLELPDEAKTETEKEIAEKKLEELGKRQVPEGKGNWRQEFNKETDPFRKSSILRAIAESSKSAEELRDVKDAAKEMPEENNIVNAVDLKLQSLEVKPSEEDLLGKPKEQPKEVVDTKVEEGSVGVGGDVETFELIENKGKWKATTKTYKGRETGNWVYNFLDKKQKSEYDKIRDKADSYGTKEDAQKNLKLLQEFESNNKVAFEKAKQAIDDLKQTEPTVSTENKPKSKLELKEKTDLGTKARDLANKIEKGEVDIIPDWLKVDLPKGTKKLGVGINDAFVSALRTFADVHDATKDVIKSVEKAIEHIVDYFKENEVEYNAQELGKKFAKEMSKENPFVAIEYFSRKASEKGSSKKETLAELREYVDSQPDSVRRVYDNFKTITTQLEEAGLLKKSRPDC